MARRRCRMCGDPAGDYTIHRDGFGRGPQVPLCDVCGGEDGPSCQEIWATLRHRGTARERLAARFLELMAPMSPREAWLEATSWGSYQRAGDPGACMYGFREDGLLQSEEHRRRCLSWIDQHCLPKAGPASGHTEQDVENLRRLRHYIETAGVRPWGDKR